MLHPTQFRSFFEVVLTANHVANTAKTKKHEKIPNSKNPNNWT